RHRPKTNFTIALSTFEVQVAHGVLVRGIGNIFIHTVKNLAIAHDAITLRLEGKDFLNYLTQAGEILNVVGIPIYAHERLEVDLHLRVLAKMTNQIRKLPVVLLHDRRFYNDAHSGTNAFLFGENIIDTFESPTRAIFEWPQCLIDFRIYRLQRDVDIEGIVRKHFP